MGKWVEACGFSHKDISIAEFFVSNQTVRYVVPIGISGSKVQIVLSNQFGNEDLVLDKVMIGTIEKDDSIKQEKLALVTYNNSKKIIIPKGEDITCDVLDYRILSGEELGISIYIKNKVRIRSGGSNLGRRYLSIEGDYTEYKNIPKPATEINEPKNGLDYFTIPTVDIIKKINVYTKSEAYCIAAFGDSITAMDYWRKPLAERLQNKYQGLVTVLNYGIIGNRLLYPTGLRGLHGVFGEAGEKRILEDGLKIKGLKYIILLEGSNDLIQPGVCAPLSQQVSANEIIDAYKRIIRKTYEHGIRVIGGTIPPFCGPDQTYWDDAENNRNIINQWIRKSDEFYAVIDFDMILADEVDKKRIKDGLHLGDWLHPNQIGGNLIAKNIDIDIFREPPC